MTDILQYNRESWNKQSLSGESDWCQPVDEQAVALARQGRWEVILTPTKPVPKPWFGELSGKKVLCLASGGGQQAPVLAAAGALVTSFDNSDEQLAKDQMVSDRDGLSVETIQGDMADLTCFDDGTFDLIFHPVSNVFAPLLAPVWRECYRVLRPSGRLLSGFMNPDYFLFDHTAIEAGGELTVRYPLPFSDIEHLPSAELARRKEQQFALEFSHSFDEQIGGQLAAGFSISGFYEDRWSDEATPLNAYMPTSFATLAVK